MRRLLIIILSLPLMAQSDRLPALFDERVKLGGWYDLQLSKAEGQGAEAAIPHLFLFADIQMSKRWRGFVEMGYRKAPAFHPDDEGDATLERAYLEYRHGIPFKIRAGKLTTPAGLWKQLQWSIMVDTNRKPLIEEMMYLPNQVTGVSALGKKMLGDLELNYEAFAARDEGHHLMNDTAARLTGGVDLNLGFSGGGKVGAFIADFRNSGEGADTAPGGRRAILLYKDLQLIPYRLSWRSEWLQMARDDLPQITGYYSRIKWQWRRDMFTNLRYDDSQEPLGLDIRRHRVGTVTQGYWPLPWLRTRLEYARHRLSTPEAQHFSEWSVWMGVLF